MIIYQESVDLPGMFLQNAPARLRHGSPVAQLVERLTVNQLVAGSSPARGANFLSPAEKRR